MESFFRKVGKILILSFVLIFTTLNYGVQKSNAEELHVSDSNLSSISNLQQALNFSKESISINANTLYTLGGSHMKINLGYYGANAARNAMNRTPLNLQNNPLSGKEITGIRNGEAYKLTFSNELIEFQKENIADFLAKDSNVQKADPSDIFSYRPQDQWLVFSQYLHESNYFDSLRNEELTSIESTLQHITDGLDSLVQNPGFNFFGGVRSQLNSYEAHLELASSTSALQFFSTNFLSGDVKNGFDQLIKGYVHHNTNKRYFCLVSETLL